jgi:hypothetical protein
MIFTYAETLKFGEIYLLFLDDFEKQFFNFRDGDFCGGFIKEPPHLFLNA